MYAFQNDYNILCHPSVLEAMRAVSDESVTGYGVDPHCARAEALIRKACGCENIAVHFLSGGTQTNLTVIAAALRPYQGVIAPVSGHIMEHETGSIEATGHKVISVPSADGKLTAEQVEQIGRSHFYSEGPDSEHMVQPKMVYLSFPTELGTLYRLEELEAIYKVCKQYGFYLYVDGARLGYGLTAGGNDVFLPDLARLCDAFYIGGTKQGTMLGEAVVITNPELNRDFRYMIKQRGGMLAKGWLMGVQFEAMFSDGLYFEIAAVANQMADRIRQTVIALGYPMPVISTTNQVFAVLPDCLLSELSKEFVFTHWARVDAEHSMVRFCTSWSTTAESVEALCEKLVQLSK